MTRVILIHHHIFKNAGTSFNYALKQHFQEQFLEYDLPNSRVVTSDRLAQFIREHPQALAISGHHIAMPTPQGTDYQTLSSVLLRRPLARVRSIYEFEKRQQARTEGSIQAKSLSFRDYVQWRLEKTPAMLSNYQTQYCARVKDLGAAYRATEKDLEIAKRNLEYCKIAGTVEQYSEFLRLAQLHLAQIYPDIVLQATHLNASAASRPASSADQDKQLKAMLINDLGQELFSTLEQNNQLDEQLYTAAEERLTAQFADLNQGDRTRSRSYHQSLTGSSGKPWGIARLRNLLRSSLKL